MSQFATYEDLLAAITVDEGREIIDSGVIRGLEGRRRLACEIHNVPLPSRC